MSFLAEMPRPPLAPPMDRSSSSSRRLTTERREAWLACAEQYPIFKLIGIQPEGIAADFCRSG